MNRPTIVDQRSAETTISRREADRRPGFAETTIMATEEFLTFAVGRGQFAVSLLHLAEVLGTRDIPPAVQTRQWQTRIVRHAATVPVLDLRIGVGAPVEWDEFTRVVILWTGPAWLQRVRLGLVVDRLGEVVGADPATFSAPASVAALLRPHVAGVIQNETVNAAVLETSMLHTMALLDAELFRRGNAPRRWP